MPPVAPAVTVTAWLVVEPTIVEPFVLAMLQEYVPPPMEVDTLPVEPAHTVPEGPVMVQSGFDVTVTILEQDEVQPPASVTTTVTV